MKTQLALATLALLTGSAFAKIQTETVEYKDGDTTLEGFVAYDDALDAPRPGVLVIHDWTGLQDYAKSRSGSRRGYCVFALRCRYSG